MEQDTLFRWNEIEPLCVIRLFLRKIWLIVLAALIGAMSASVLLTVITTPVYSSSITFAVASRSGSYSTYTNINAAAEVAAIYSELLQSDLMDDTIRDALDGITGNITAQQLGETNLVQVRVTADTPHQALQVAQALVEHQQSISDYVSSAAVLSPLDAPDIIVSSSNHYSRRTFCLTAAAGCAVLMAVLLFVITASARPIQNRTGARSNLDGKLLASVPHETLLRRKSRFTKDRNKGDGKTRITVTSPLASFAFSEALHQVSTRLEHEKAKGNSVFLFSSVSVAEGKSTIAANVALSLAASSASVLLMDLDLRRPVQYQILNTSVPEKSQLDRLLRSNLSAEQILGKVRKLPDSTLNMLLAVKGSVGSVKLLSSPLLADIIALARAQYDYVIIDSPPLGCFSDSEVLADLVDASVLVVRQDVAGAADINDAIDSLRESRSQFLGYVLNDMQHLFAASSGYGYGYGSRYYGKYGKYGKYSKYGYDETNSSASGRTRG